MLFSSLRNSSKHKHHDHDVFPTFEYSERVIKGTGKKILWKKVKTGNYIGACCISCNTSMTSKRKRAVCYFHNGSNYDLPSLLYGMVSKKSYIKDISILPKGAHSYYNIKFRNASFIDTCSFISASLSELVDLKCAKIDLNKPEETIPITINRVKQKFGSEVLKYVTRKGVYPYNLCKNVNEMKSVTEYPPKEAFYDVLGEKI